MSGPLPIIDVRLGSSEHQALATAIFDTIREPLIVLDSGLRAVTASRSFYLAFEETPQETVGRALYELGNGQWNIPALRALLEGIIPHHTAIEQFEVEHDFPKIGRRTMLLNARRLSCEGEHATSLLLAIEDITERRMLEREKDELLRQKDLLLHEMHHRVNNSLQIIAAILLLKANAVQSEETRLHLNEAHQRVVAIARVQDQLQPTVFGTRVQAGEYLTRLCDSLAASMIRDGRPIALRVDAGDGAMSSEQAVSMGLITTELVMNALKHAFPGRGGTIAVRYKSDAVSWRLSVSDDGVGMGANLTKAPSRTGLGTSLVEALTRQLGGRVATSAASPGTTVSVIVPRPVVAARGHTLSRRGHAIPQPRHADAGQPSDTAAS